MYHIWSSTTAYKEYYQVKGLGLTGFVNEWLLCNRRDFEQEWQQYVNLHNVVEIYRWHILDFNIILAS